MKKNEIIIKIVQTNKLTQKQLLEIGNKANNLNVWKFIFPKLSLEDFSKEKLVEIGNNANNLDIWEAIVKTNKLTQEQLLDLGNKLVNAFGVWDAIVQTNKLNQEQLLDFGNKLNDSDVWEVIYEALKD